MTSDFPVATAVELRSGLEVGKAEHGWPFTEVGVEGACSECCWQKSSRLSTLRSFLSYLVASILSLADETEPVVVAHAGRIC